MTSFASNPRKVIDWPRSARWVPILLAGLFAVVLLYGAVTTHGFLTVGNGRSILLASAFVGLIAVGMTPIMLSGNLFSLSLATTAAVSAMMFLYTMSLGLVPALILTIVLGGVVCALQGWVVGALGANPIIITIAAGVVLQGVVSWLTSGATVYPTGNVDYEFLRERIVGIPFPFFALAGAVVLTELLLRRTRFGWELRLLGENKAAAKVAGLPVTGITVGAFAIAGACAGLAGILLGAFNQNATLSIESTYTFDAIAAVLVGGSAVTGGHGSTSRTLFGALVIAAITSMLLIRGWSTGAQIIAKGVIVLGTVAALQVMSKARVA